MPPFSSVLFTEESSSFPFSELKSLSGKRRHRASNREDKDTESPLSSNEYRRRNRLRQTLVGD